MLVLEGAIPVAVPEACRFAGRTLGELLPPIIGRARFVVAAGTCASHGGIPSAEGAVTGAASVREFMEKTGGAVQSRLVCASGCPCHPAELLGTLAHLAAKGYPEVRPDWLTPTMFSTGCLHFQCPRLPMFNARIFAAQFGALVTNFTLIQPGALHRARQKTCLVVDLETDALETAVVDV